MSEGRTFRRVDGDRIVADVSGDELALLRGLHADLRELVAGEHDPLDPVVSRLFPPRLGDEVDAATVDSLHAELLASRLAGLDAVMDVVERSRRRGRQHRLELHDDEPSLFLGVLNDLRLAIGARIGVETLDPETVHDDPQLLHAALVMDHLAGWVDDLVAVLDPAAAAWQDDHHGPV